MIFLIEYDRDVGQIVTMRTFKDSERETAHKSRLDLELELNAQRVEHEVVLLEAANEEAVRRTHRRYFEDIHQLASPSPG